MVVERLATSGTITGTDLKEYLTKNIDFVLDGDKRKAMNLFLDITEDVYAISHI